MPYRRLPNTDSSRLKALHTALAKGKDLPPFKLAFSQSSLQKIQEFLTGFEQALILKKQDYLKQVEHNKVYQKTIRKVRLYISHFIQVMNMAIARGEISSTTRSFYGLKETDKNLPSLQTEAEIIEWGQNLINGEAKRILKGLSPITNPTSAVVKVRYEQFLDAYNFQKTLQKKNALNHQKLSVLREKANQIILQTWNEVEEYYSDLPENMKREKAKEYGLAYVFRKNEMRNITFADDQHKGIG
jgi:hypothetical protein